MEVPDILPWVKPQELLLTTGYPLRAVPESLTALVGQLAGRGLAGLAVKRGRYLPELPPAMLEEADRLGLPIIGLPDAVSFDDVINQVLTEVLNRQAAVLARSEEAHQALVQIVLTGGGLDRLCEELVGICGGVAMVTTPDGRVLASAGGLEQVEDLGCFDGSGRFIVEAEPVGSRPAGSPASSRVVVRIVAGALDHGRLVAFSSEREMGDDDVHLLEGAATVAALAITKALAVSAVESKYQADFLRDALAGRAGSAERGHRSRRLPRLGHRPLDGGGGRRDRPHRDAEHPHPRRAALGAGTVRDGLGPHGAGARSPRRPSWASARRS